MDSNNTSVTETLAEWAVQSRWSTIAPGAKSAASRSWLNWLGCALGGSSSPEVENLLTAVRCQGKGDDSHLLGRADTADPATSALIHAFASNVLDYDDTHWATAIHPAGPVASALVPLAQQTNASGEEFLHCFLLGMEAECRIGMAISPGHYERGWHITATCGIFGAAVAAGRMMGLTKQQMAWAIGHAATQSSGLVASLGTMAKSLNIAHAARNGLLAAQMARHGITSNQHALETRFGFGDVMGSGPIEQTMCEHLGDRWECEDNTFKPYPCGFLLHPAVEACMTLSAADDIGDKVVEDLVVRVHPLAQVRADRVHPANGLQAKLSLQHAVAVALLLRNAGVGCFTDQAVHESRVAALREKVRLIGDEGLTTRDACVEVRFEGSEHVYRSVWSPSAAAARQMSTTQLQHKFRELVTYGAPHCDATRLLNALHNFPESQCAAELFQLTRAPSVLNVNK